VLISGLDMPEAMATTDEPGGDHARGAVLLSGARPRRNAVSPFLGTTIDQHIAKKYGQDTILSSLQLGVEDTATSATATGATAAPTRTPSRGRRPPSRCRRRSTRASCSSGCSATAPAPRSAAATASATPACSTRWSISSGRSRRNLGADDKARVDTYVDNIRELERRIKIAMDNSVKEPSADVPFGSPRASTCISA
jgi:hypothetical protein